MSIDVTDASFQTDVLDRSTSTPVVVDLWAPWCGPCRTLGPILEKVVDETDGKVVLVKVNVDENQQVSQAFRVQGIPAVYAVDKGKVVDGFVGAQPEPAVRDFIDRLLPSETEQQVAALLEAGDEASLRQVLDQQPDHHDAIVALAELLAGTADDGAADDGAADDGAADDGAADDGAADEALALLDRIPETPETRRVAALIRTRGTVADDADDEITAKLDGLLTQVKGDDDARQEYVDLLEVLGPDDPRTADYRKRLTRQLF